MRNLIIALMAFLPVGLQAGIALSFDDPVVYNNYIVDQQNVIGQALEDYTTAFNDKANGYDELTLALEKLSSRIRESIKPIEDLESYNGDDALRQSALALFRFYRTTINTDYSQILDLSFGKGNTANPQSQIEAILKRVSENEEAFDNAYIQAQEAFARKNNFSLEK